MSLLNVWVSPERAMVAVDTDGINPAGQHFGMSKLLVLPHAEIVFAFRGDRRFMHDLFSRFYLAACDVDFDAVMAAMPQMLASVILGFREASAAPQPYEVAVVGWSASESRLRGFWCTGRTDEDDWDREEIEGARITPWRLPNLKITPNVEGMQELGKQQATWLRADGDAGGGRLLVAQLTRREIILRDEGVL